MKRRRTGFFRLYDALEAVDKIRILVDLKVDGPAFEIIDFAIRQNEIDFHSASPAPEK